MRERHVAADLAIELELDAAVREPLDAALHDILLELEVRDAVDEQAAGAVVAVEYRDLVALQTKLLRAGEPCGPCADHGHMLRTFAPRFQRLHPAFVPGGVAQELLDRADGDGAVARLLDDAIALAEAILRTDAAADLGHVVGGLRKLVSLFQPALGGELQPVGDVVLERAVHLAEGHAALRAARGLLGGFLGGVAGIDLLEIPRARHDGALFGPVRIDGWKL